MKRKDLGSARSCSRCYQQLAGTYSASIDARHLQDPNMTTATAIAFLKVLPHGVIVDARIFGYCTAANFTTEISACLYDMCKYYQDLRLGSSTIAKPPVTVPAAAAVAGSTSSAVNRVT
ncbi:hypothetical protein VTN02DRAFT_3583 [Thermoascus thermophilus]